MHVILLCNGARCNKYLYKKKNGFLFLSAAVMCLHTFRVQISQGRDAELNTIRVGVRCLWFLLLHRTLSSWKI